MVLHGSCANEHFDSTLSALQFPRWCVIPSALPQAIWSLPAVILLDQFMGLKSQTLQFDLSGDMDTGNSICRLLLTWQKTFLCRAQWEHFSLSEGAKHKKVMCYRPHRTSISCITLSVTEADSVRSMIWKEELLKKKTKQNYL